MAAEDGASAGPSRSDMSRLVSASWSRIASSSKIDSAGRVAEGGYTTDRTVLSVVAAGVRTVVTCDSVDDDSEPHVRCADADRIAANEAGDIAPLIEVG